MKSTFDKVTDLGDAVRIEIRTTKYTGQFMVLSKNEVSKLIGALQETL